MVTNLNILLRQVEDLAFREMETLKRAITLGMPYADALTLTGRGPVEEGGLRCINELKGYQETGLTAAQIIEMDELYHEKCVEVCDLKKQLQETAKQRDEYREKHARALREMEGMRRELDDAEFIRHGIVKEPLKK